VRADITVSTRPEGITRRMLLAAAAVEAARSFAQTSEAECPSRIIDTHTHFYDPARPQGVPWPSKSESLLYRRTLPEDLRKVVQGLRVTGTVVVEASPWLEDNQWLLDLAKEDPLIVGVVGHLEPGGPMFKSHLQRFAKHRLFRGIRIDGKTIATGLSQPAFIADLHRLVDADLEIDAIGENSLLSDLVTLSDRVPRLRIVIDHLPFDPPADKGAGNKARNAFRELGQRPRVFAKVSGVLRRITGRVPLEASFYRQALDQLCDNFGVDRLIYGSNWPVSNLLAPYGAVLHVVREYFFVKGAEPTEKYFWKNSLTAYKWVDNG
jgi:L-fucono-1,5-lactonase